MSSWWNSTNATNFTRGLSSITGQLSNNLKDILTEASEETFDPAAELTRARQQIDDLEFRKHVLMEECTSLKKQCDELTMQKQAVEIKSDMLLAESRRTMDEKDNELKRLRENTNTISWNNSSDLNNTWTDILEDDQPEISEYLKYQKMIRDLKDENDHLRDEMATLRTSMKSQQSEKKQYRREDDLIQIEQVYSEQMSKCRQEYEEHIRQLQIRIQQLEDSNELQQNDELRRTIEVQKEVDDVDKDLLSHELEQANNKLNWFNDKFQEYTDLQSNIDLLRTRNQQLENDLLAAQEKNEVISEDFHQLRSAKQCEEREQQTDITEDFNCLLIEERQRCDALVTDNETMCHLLEETRSQLNIQLNLSEEQTLRIDNLLNQIRIQQEQIDDLQNTKQQSQIEENQKEKKKFQDELHEKDNLLEEQKSKCQSLEQQLNEQKNSFFIQINNLQQFQDEQLIKDKEEEENHSKEFHLREMLERQLIELNEDVQTLESEKNEFHQQIEQLKEQLESKDRQIQNLENTTMTPGSPSAVPSSPNTRTRSPSPETFEHLLELEAQFVRNEQQFRELNAVYERFVTILPIELLSNDHHQLSLSDRFVNLFEQWSTYVDTLSITQQELDSLKQLLIEKQDDLEKLQFDLDLTTTKLIEQQSLSLTQEQSAQNDDDEDEIEHILELHQYAQRAPSRQSLISSTPGEKQQLIAQNELLSSLLADKDRELISLQQAEKTREDLIKTLETLRTNLQQIELDKELKQVELNDIRNVLDEKIRENSSLKKEKMYFIDKLAGIERERQEQQPIIQVSRKQSIREEEKSSTTITQSQNDETVSDEKQNAKLRFDYDQLVEFSKKQHDECLSYYNEYTRILSLYNDLNSKHSQFQIDYESLQSLIQQKNEGYLQCQNELNHYQNLLYHEKKKSEEIDVLRSTIIERDNKLQQYIANEAQFLLKQSELERELKLLESNNFEFKSNEQSLLEQLQQTNTEQIQFEFKRIAHERDLAIAEKKQSENENELTRQKFLQFEERERKFTNEIERLRTHLLQMEESYTNDLLAAEDREKFLRNQLAQFEDSNQAQTELIQQLNTSGEQSKQALATELGTLKYEYNKLETSNKNLNNQLQYQMKCSQNLQNVLEQFKREREQHIDDHFRQYQDALREQTSIVTRLTNENNEIRHRLAEYNEALSAAQRLNDHIEKTDFLINTLRNENHEKDKQIQQYEYNLRDLQSTSGTRVEKQLVKNILLSYFHTPIDKRQEVVPLLGALVGFTQDEYRKAIDATSNSNNAKGGTGWLAGWLAGNTSATNPVNSHRTRTQSETPAYDPNKSFTELLIQYVDQQSIKNPQFPTAKFNTDEYLHRYDNSTPGGNPHLLRKSSLSASTNPFVNSTYLSLNKQTSTVVLPTSNNRQDGAVLPATPLSSSSSTTESSSTILKDLLKA